MISVDTVLHELGYSYNGSSPISGLTIHEIQKLLSDRREMNKTSAERDEEWKEEQLNMLKEMNIEEKKSKVNKKDGS